MRRGWIVLAAAGLGLALAAAAASALFEVVEVEIEGETRGEALRDPLLAARRLLAALGVPAEAWPGVSPLPPVDHALLLLAPEGSLSIPEGEQVLAWVERGDRLVATAQSPLLAPFGLEAVSIEDAAGEAGRRGGGPRHLTVEARPGRAFRVGLRGDRRFVDPEGSADFASGPEGALTLVHVLHGEGRVTFLPERWFLENREIGHHQHAALLWALVTVDGRPAGARVVGGFERPELLALLVRRAGPALIAGGLLLAAWAARRAARFGPPLPDPQVERRSLLEHVRATGDFLWRKDRGADLEASVRRGLERAAARLHPGWERVPPEERIDRLAAASGLDRETVAWAVDPAADPAPRRGTGAAVRAGDRETFTRRIRILEQVRRSS